MTDNYDWEADAKGCYDLYMKIAGEQVKETGTIPECLLGDGEHTQRLLSDREQTHGDFQSNAFLAQRFRYLFRSHGGWDRLSDIEREALDNIATKLSRIMSGGNADSWRDIAGYAT